MPTNVSHKPVETSASPMGRPSELKVVVIVLGRQLDRDRDGEHEDLTVIQI